MKIPLLITVLILQCILTFNDMHGQKPSGVLMPAKAEPFRTIAAERDHLAFEYVLPPVSYRIVETERGRFLKLGIPGFSNTGSPGTPEVLVAAWLIELDQPFTGADFRIQWADSVVIDLDEIEPGLKMVPAQPSAAKSDTARMAFMMDEAEYSSDQWCGGPLLHCEFQGKVRGLPVSNLYFSPVRYNPAENRLIIYCHVRASIPLPEPGKMPAGLYSPAFRGVYSRIVRRQEAGGTKAIYAEEPMTLVILSDTLFRQTLQPFITWKRKKGFRVIEAYTQDPDVGTGRESIKSFLKALYQNPPEGFTPPSYLILAGDIDRVPVSHADFYTDLYYAEYDGNGDYIPDLFYGRLPAQTVPEMEVIVNKSLAYEQYGFPDPLYLTKSLLAAGGDNAYEWDFSNGQVNYAATYYFNSANGIEGILINAPSADSMNQFLLDKISEGVGFLNYSGHATTSYWKDPYFSTAQVDGLMNTGKYPVVIGNGCQSGAFQVGECLAEALIRTGGKGALAYIGCTYDAYWEEDYYWSVGVGAVSPEPLYENTGPGYYDKVFHLYHESRDIWAPSLGEMVFAGNMSVQESTSSRKEYYWRIYHILGDPTIIPWFGVPEQHPLSYPAVLPAGTTRLDLAGLPYDYIAVSANGSLINAAHANAYGFLSLSIPDTLERGTLSLVATGERRIPFIDSVVVGTPEEGYADLAGYRFAGESVTSDQVITNGESFGLDLTFINRGAEAVLQDTITLFTRDSSIIAVDSLVVIESLLPGDTLVIENGFRIQTLPTVADQTPFILVIRTTGEMVNRAMYIGGTIAAPSLFSAGLEMDDRKFGNGNGVADPGEMAELIWQVENRGHYRSGNLSVTDLTPVNKKVLDLAGFSETAPLQQGEKRLLHLRCIFRNDIIDTLYTVGPFQLTDGTRSTSDGLFVHPGRHIERFTCGDFSRFVYQKDAYSPWFADSLEYLSPGFAARSGNIGDNGQSRLSIGFRTARTDSISFSYKVSSETGYDYFRFYVDSLLIMQEAGVTGWKRFTAVLGPGDHFVTWSYEKDLSLHMGEDAAWIDDIVFPAEAFRDGDISLMEISSPVSGPWLSDMEKLEIIVRNTGMDTTRTLCTVFSLDHTSRAPDSLDVIIAPGESRTLILADNLDLKTFKRYRLRCSVTAEGDFFTGNNSLDEEIEHYIFPDVSLSLDELESLPGVYASLRVRLENDGNIPIDSIPYSIHIDGILKEEGMETVLLAPSESVVKSYRIIDSTECDLESGYYEYLFETLLPDSIEENNRLTGILFWQVYSSGDRNGPVAFSIWPNPAHGGFYLQTDSPLSEERWFSIIDLHGTVLKTFRLAKGEQGRFIPVQGLSGTYLLRSDGYGRTLKLQLH
ncbi:MAG: hypothetical protein JXR52_09045 [Bacteroidales bacterium]|nr:hypothetical protein [Bacteroidales bacterium]MBN2698960.1 hypothetical protein [Bacteroidales bacterium]